MAKSDGGSPRRGVRAEGAGNGSAGSQPDGAGVSMPGHTGNYLVLLPGDDSRAGVKALNRIAGLRVAHSSDFGDEPATLAALDQAADALVLDELGVAVVGTPPDQLQALGAADPDSGILAVEPERVVYALNEMMSGVQLAAPPALPAPPPVMPGLGAAVPWTGDYLRGYREAVNHLVGGLLGEPSATPADALAEAALQAFNEAELTWGLQVTKAGLSRFTGQGVGVAVLDTGMDLLHPDFATRQVRSQSFVPGQSAQDGHGHGTHCIGTACGPRLPLRLPRYGVATAAEIHAGKVLSNQGSGADGGILAGIQWAIRSGCAVASMSLGAAVPAGTPPSPVFEAVGRRALRAGTLIVAAAGNESRRPHLLNPVGHPANCETIMAVGSVDQQLRMSFFSNAAGNGRGGQVDIVGPGTDVTSAWPRPALYNTISGTSMATPHVAGIAALLAEANPGARGWALWALLVQTARRLPLPARDAGMGLVQAP